MSYDDPRDTFRGGPPQQRRSKSDGPGEDYIEVRERIQLFYAAYPTGAVVTDKVKYINVGDMDEKPRVVVRAKAYRTPDDPHPGVGNSWMVVPGRTPYTNGSELENAETSAWGRAIAAVGIAIDRSIATAQEVASKRGPDEAAKPDKKPESLAAVVKERASPKPKEAPPAADTPEGSAPVPEAAPRGPETLPVVAETLPLPVEPDTGEVHALSYDHLRSNMRERNAMAGFVGPIAKSLFPKGGTLESLTDEQRWELWQEVERRLAGK